MPHTPDYFAAVEEDWNLFTLAGLRACLRDAYRELRQKSDPAQDPNFGTPNGPMVAGVMRWMFVDRHLALGCRSDIMPGITANWLHLGDGGVYALELRGRRTSLMAFHLNYPDSSIRESRLRFEKRFTNQMNPIFPQWDAPEAEADGVRAPLINLVLVHGGKRADFAYLRAYHDPEDIQRYITMSSNIIEQPIVSSVAGDAEPEAIEEVQPQLKASFGRDERSGQEFAAASA